MPTDCSNLEHQGMHRLLDCAIIGISWLRDGSAKDGEMIVALGARLLRVSRIDRGPGLVSISDLQTVCHLHQFPNFQAKF